MQVQTSPQTEDERLALGVTTEAVPTKIEQPPATNVEDLSGLEQDKLELKKAAQGMKVEVNGEVFTTLREAPTEPRGPMPTESQVEAGAKDQLVKEIEQAMSAGLAQIDPKTKQLTGIFTEIPADKQSLLKQEGERIAHDIDDMFKTGKLDLQEIHNDLLQWLLMIPAVNQPWLEQQATIITDKIANIFQEYKRDINLN